jgi:hypothetical protein
MAHKTASWNTLGRVQADIALLNEARVPSKGVSANLLGGERTEGRDSYKREWAAAILSPHPLREIDDATASRYGRKLDLPFVNSRPGSWTAGMVSIEGLGEVTAIALYGLMDEKSDTSVHRSLSELAPIFDDKRYNKHLILGGDLNTWTGWAAGSMHLERDRVVLERIRAYGLVDCLEAKREPGRINGCPCSLGDECRHTRTRIDPRRPEVPYQMVYLFASKSLVGRLTRCEALASSHEPSDHFPISATFES